MHGVRGLMASLHVGKYSPDHAFHVLEHQCKGGRVANYGWQYGAQTVSSFAKPN